MKTSNLLSLLSTILDGAQTWDDIYCQLLNCNSNSNNSAGTLFELFCKFYYLSAPSVKHEYKNVWLFEEIPHEIKEKLNLGKIDHGIDLVLKHQNDTLAVLQCKFRNNQKSNISWTKDKLANLFADGDKADYFIIFTNASGLDKHSLSKKSNQLKLVSLGDLLNISTAIINEIKNHINGKTAAIIDIKQPKKYQEIAIENVIKRFEKNDRGQLILPCGAGKTLVSLWIKNKLNSKNTLILVPSLALLRQIKYEWASNSNRYIPYICVCSEKDIDKNKDVTIAHMYEISGRVSTDPNEIRNFLNNHDETIVYATYQSLETICAAVKNSSFVFNLAICDEAHKTSGGKHSKYGLIHLDSNIPVQKRLYMTATPRILSGSLKNELNDETLNYIHDMSNPSIFGFEFYRMSFKEAIEKEILVDYQIIAIGVDNKELEEAIKQRIYISDDETIDGIANNYALEKFMQKYSPTHAITFHSSVKKAKSFQLRHQNIYPEISTFHVNGELSTNERTVLMKAFETSPKSVVTNARCLTEGIDVPAIDVVYFCDPKNSKIDIVQATGRALRRADHKNKKIGYVVVPIFHQNQENIEEMIKNSTFNNLISVIRALGAHDGRLVEEIKKINIGTKKPETQHISFDYSCNLIILEGFAEELRNSIFDQIISQTRIQYRSFEEAKRFVHTLKLSGQTEWKKYYKSGERPDDIPCTPDRVYEKAGWISWGDWFGTNIIAPMYRIYHDFDAARSFVHNLNLKSHSEWISYCKTNKKPDDIPNAPHHVYKESGWISWGDWLCNDKKVAFRPFQEARKFVHSLGMKTSSDWNRYCSSGSKPADIPKNAAYTYKDTGWKSVGDWLGSDFVANQHRVHRDFGDALNFIYNLGLKNRDDWREYLKSGKKPIDIPADPQNAYKNKGWKSFGHWLGTGKIANQKRVFRNFNDARKFVQTLKIKNMQEWKIYCKSEKKPNDIPTDPKKTYKTTEWKSMGDWLGTDEIAHQNKKYRSFEDAKAFVHSLQLKNTNEWKKYCKSGKKPDDIPAAANSVYQKQGWISFVDWLGK